MRTVRYPQLSTLLTALVAVAALVLSAVGDAADETQPPKSDDPAAKADDAPAEEEKDPYALPAEDASNEAILLFMKRLARMQPKEQSPEGFTTHLNKLDEAFGQLLTRMLEDDLAAQASNLRYQILSVLGQIGDETAGKRRDEFVASLVKDERPAIAKLGRQIGFVERIQALPSVEDAERQQLVDDIVAYMQEGEIEGLHVGLAMQTARTLEQVAPEMAVSAYNVFAKHIEASGNPELAAIAPALYGSARRLELPGHPIEIAGKTIDGKDFDIKDLKGKVVLVDFWATWCGPCIAEMPNVLDNYEKYHDKGFEVVGISLDDNPEALQAFIDENNIPWATLFEEDETKRGFENPIAQHYGITGIPTVILVNQEGNVVSLEARDDTLDELLAELLGPPLEKPAPEEAPAPEEKPAATKKPGGLKIPTKQPLGKQ